MNSHFELYPRGFIFGDRNFYKTPQEYNEVVVNDVYYYSFYRNINHLIFEEEDKFIIIHGNATFVHHKININQSELAQYLLNLFYTNYNDFLNALDFIGGRYAIIIGDKKEVMVYQDATGGRSVYYSLEHNIISSHANLLNDNESHLLDTRVSKVKRLGVTWNLSPYTNIKALTPNLCLELYSKKTKRFFPRGNNKYTEMNEEDRIALAELLWKKQNDYYFNNYSNIALSITGGLDSRVSLAMLKDEISNIEFFTYMTEAENPNDDKNIRSLKNDGIRVKKILEDIKLNHRFIKIENSSGNLSEKENEIVSRNTIGNHNFKLLKRYKRLFPDSNILHIRSNLNEIGRAYFMERNIGNNLKRVNNYFINSFKRTNEELLNRNNIELDEVASQGINAFKYKEDRYDYHIMDLYYWENQMGRWISEILNETDVCFETYSAYNLRAIIDISLSFPFEYRKESLFFKKLINRNFPILNFYGVNSDENLFESYTKLLNDYKSKIDLLKKEKQIKNNSENNLVAYAQKSSEKIYDKITNLKNEILNEPKSEVTNLLNHILMLNKANIDYMQKSVSNSKINLSEIFSDIKIIHNNSEKLIKTEDLNTLFIPVDYLIRGNYAEKNFVFNAEYGFLELSLSSKYTNSKGDNYLKYVILKNDKKILQEDISHWKFENSIFIYNLEKDDVIKIRVEVMKTCQSKSWSNASKVVINDIKENQTNHSVDQEVIASSPYSKITFTRN